jgi:hypothetical protein
MGPIEDLLIPLFSSSDYIVGSAQTTIKLPEPAAATAVPGWKDFADQKS